MYADPSEKNVCNFGTDLVSLTIDSTKNLKYFLNCINMFLLTHERGLLRSMNVFLFLVDYYIK